MQFDKVTDADIDDIKKLQPNGWPDISKEFERYISYNFCEPIKMLIDNKIIGLGNSIIFRNTAWLAHIIVNKSYRNRGIGYKIVDTLVSDLKTKMIETILLIATELGEPVYKKIGFRYISDYVYLKRETSWIDKEISNNILPYSEQYYNQIVKLDTLISGENRESLIKMYLDDCLIYLDKQILRGFYLPSLGEGPIFAENSDIGIELMKIKYSKVDAAVIPSENEHGINFLIQNGFIKTDSICKRMVLGKDINWRPDCFLCRVGGNYG